MTWWAIEVQPGTRDPDLVAQLLARLSGQAVLERPDGAVVGYAPERSAAETIAGRLAAELAGTGVRLDPVGPADWTERWRDGIEVRQVGRLSVGPSWLLEPGPDRIVVDPETAFGTGEHGSTRAALALLGQYVRPGISVFDVGSGSGVLAIGAVRLGAGRALGMDLDPGAEPVAEANARRNGVEARAAFLTGDAAVLLPLLGVAGLVVANILRGVNTALLPTVRAALEPAGTAIFSGMEAAERSLFLPPLRAAGFEPTGELEDAGWWAVAAVPV